jgi:hypothetical protein
VDGMEPYQGHSSHGRRAVSRGYILGILEKVVFRDDGFIRKLFALTFHPMLLNKQALVYFRGTGVRVTSRGEVCR